MLFPEQFGDASNMKVSGEQVRILVTHLDQSLTPIQAKIRPAAHKYWTAHKLDLSHLNWAQIRPSLAEPARSPVTQMGACG